MRECRHRRAEGPFFFLQCFSVVALVFDRLYDSDTQRNLCEGESCNSREREGKGESIR